MVSDFPDKLAMLDIDADEYHRYYYGFISEYLYPLLLDCPEYAVAPQYYSDFLSVNDRILQTLRAYQPERLLICDYHLYRVPLLASWPCQKVFFWFLPFLDPSRHAPLVKDVVDGLSRCDIVFFFTSEYVDNFLKSVESYFPGRPVTCRPVALVSGADPSYLDTQGVTQDAYSELLSREFGVRYSSDCTYFLSASRLDYVKGIPLVIDGFDLSFRRLSETMCPHLLVAAPHHRNAASAYKAEQDRIGRAFERADSRDHVHLSYHHFTREELRVLYRYSKAFIVGSRIDGMPITPLEYCLSNAGDGAIVISDATGASAFMEGGVYKFRSGDPADLSRALLAAMTEPASIRRRKLRAAKSRSREVTIDKWLEKVEHAIGTGAMMA
ncbi:MAG: trehalose-6-phosphate synthase [Chloroflexi bacterium]|nr:trehalose-6-phosphate synthase [Chloroflexota bacterium]